MGKRFDRVKIYKPPCLYHEIDVNMKLTKELSEVQPTFVDNLVESDIAEKRGYYSRIDFYRFMMMAQYFGYKRMESNIMTDYSKDTYSRLMMILVIRMIENTASVSNKGESRYRILNEVPAERYCSYINNLLHYINESASISGIYGRVYLEHQIKRGILQLMNAISDTLKLGIKYVLS